MNDEKKAKLLLEYNGNLLKVDNLPIATVDDMDMERLSDVKRFDDFFLTDTEKQAKQPVSVSIKLHFIGTVEDLHYLMSLKKVSIIPRD